MPATATDILGFPDSFPAMFYVTDMHGRFEQVDEEWLAALGYDHVEVIGRNNVECLSDKCRATAHEHMLALFESGSLDDLEYEFIAKSGEILHFCISAKKITDDASHPVGSVALLRSIDTDNEVVQQLTLISYPLRGIETQEQAARMRTLCKTARNLWCSQNSKVTRRKWPAFKFTLNFSFTLILREPV